MATTSRTDVCSLKEVCRRLQDDLGDSAPAEITIKRWSASGRLKTAEVRIGGTPRPRWRYSVVLRIVRSSFAKADADVEPLPASSRPPAAGPSDGLRPEHITEIVHQAIADALRRLPSPAPAVATAMHPEVQQAVANLAAAQRALMLKYDSEINQLRQRLAETQEQLKAARNGALDLMRLNGNLSAVAARLDALLARPDA